MIQGWYYVEKLDASHPQRLKVKRNSQLFKPLAHAMQMIDMSGHNDIDENQLIDRSIHQSNSQSDKQNRTMCVNIFL